jgi:large subunit ribosomal protein L31
VKEGIHPQYNPVIFRDVSSGDQIMTRSTITSAVKEVVDGVEYNVISMDITSFTHPFFTGKQKLLDTEGRIDRFRRKYGNKVGADVAAGATAAPTGGEGAEN